MAMTGLSIFTNAIEKSGLKKKYIANQLGISVQSLSKKLNGERDFKISELQMLICLLGLDKDSVEAIFFAHQFNNS